MFVFNRGLSDDFVRQLNAEYDTRRYWKYIAADTDFLIVLRNAALEIHWSGHCLVTFERQGSQIVGNIHYRYLLRHDLPKPMLHIYGDTISLPNASSFFLNDISNTAAIKRAAEPYIRSEEAQLYRIIRGNGNVIDVDIVLKTNDGREERFDFAALRADTAEGAELVFYRAYPFSSLDIRGAGKESPPAIEQIECCRDIIAHNGSALENAYRRLCKNLTDFYWVWDRYDAVSIGLIHRVAEGAPLRINDQPRLVIFGLDGDQRDGREWAACRKKLETAFGSRLLLKCDPHEFMRGISTGP